MCTQFIWRFFFFFFFCILEVTNMATVKNFHLFISDIFNVIGIYTTENYTEKWATGFIFISSSFLLSLSCILNYLKESSNYNFLSFNAVGFWLDFIDIDNCIMLTKCFEQEQYKLKAVFKIFLACIWMPSNTQRAWKL